MCGKTLSCTPAGAERALTRQCGHPFRPSVSQTGGLPALHCPAWWRWSLSCHGMKGSAHSLEGWPSRIHSFTTMPVAGASVRPEPSCPAATNTPGQSGTGPITGRPLVEEGRKPTRVWLPAKSTAARSGRNVIARAKMALSTPGLMAGSQLPVSRELPRRSFPEAPSVAVKVICGVVSALCAHVLL